MRSIRLAVVAAVLVGGLALAQKPAAVAKHVAKNVAKDVAKQIVQQPDGKPLLPGDFAGWVADAAPRAFKDVAEADSVNAAALKEYGYKSGMTALYKRDGQSLTLHALSFHDASGAYGAYSFYRQNNWPKEEIGSGAASNKTRVLFWVGSVLIDANFEKLSAMSAAELRELAAGLPQGEGRKAELPPVMDNLPKTSLDLQTTHYAAGPVSYVAGGGVLPAELVGFDRGADVITANYALRSGVATLTLIDYPTPQMAEAQEQRIRAYIQAGSKAQPAWPKPLVDSDLASLEVHRSGPVVALVSGDAIPDESHKLVASVHFSAEVVSMPLPGQNEIAKTGKLLFGIAMLVLVGAGAAIILGVFFGGGRAFYRVLRGKPASTVYDEEFISLDLGAQQKTASQENAGSHPKG